MEGQRGGGIDSVLISTGRLGLSTGRGYYIYKQRGKPGVPDPDVEAMIDADRTAKQIKIRVLTDGEIRARCVSAMAGAGAHLMGEGIAKRAEDIDMIAIHGLGFARRSGGVMFAADLLGPEQVLKHVTAMSRESAAIKPPAPLLTEIVENDGFFTLLDQQATNA